MSHKICIKYYFFSFIFVFNFTDFTLIPWKHDDCHSIFESVTG